MNTTSPNTPKETERAGKSERWIPFAVVGAIFLVSLLTYSIFPKWSDKPSQRIAQFQQTPAPARPETMPPTPEPRRDPREETVYITETGEKFHRDGCQHLRKSKIAIEKKKAISQGYTACSRCNP